MSIYYHPTIVYYRDKYLPKDETLKEKFSRKKEITFIGYMQKRDEQEQNYKKNKPVLYFLLKELPIAVDGWLDSLNSIYLVFKNYFYPYNVVKCRYLNVNYHDKDLVMEHCVLELLAQFVEKEEPWEFEVSNREIAIQYEEELYYREKRSVVWAKLKKAYYFYKHLEDIADLQDQKKIKRLYNEAVMNTVTYREYLWT